MLMFYMSQLSDLAHYHSRMMHCDNTFTHVWLLSSESLDLETSFLVSR